MNGGVLGGRGLFCNTLVWELMLKGLRCLRDMDQLGGEMWSVAGPQASMAVLLCQKG